MPTVLYTQQPSVYDQMADTWPATRDARKWAGPGPAIAHPPCGPWCRLKGQWKKGQADCGLIAIAQIRNHGGIVEQPADSSLWLATGARCGDLWHGQILRIYQSDFGHPALKPTDLYFVGLPPPPPLPPPKRTNLRPLQNLSHRQRAATPYHLALWLLKWVQHV